MLNEKNQERDIYVEWAKNLKINVNDSEREFL